MTRRPGGNDLDRRQAGAIGAAAATGRQLDQLAGGDAGHLADGVMHRIVRPKNPRRYGMCGLLTSHDPAAAAISPLIAPTRPPTSLRWAKMKMASAGIMDTAVNA
jgi:hypothetical protein